MDNLMNRMMTLLRLRRFKLPMLALPFALAASLVPGNAFSSPHVFVVTAQDPKIAPFQLLDVSTRRHKKIADIGGNFLYGSDDEKLAIVQQSGSDCRILVINRSSGRVNEDGVLNNICLLSGLAPISDELTVFSKENTVCFPGTDRPNGIHPKLACGNWKTSKTRSLPEPLGGMTMPILWTGDAAGFAMGFPVGMPWGGVGMQHVVRVASYDVKTQKQLFSTDLQDEAEVSARRELFYVPKVGLVQSYRGRLTQFTGPDCASVITNKAPLSTSGADSRIFVRTVKKKICFIWGEDNSAAGLAGRNTGEITDLVVFDPEANKELVRKALTPKASVIIQPDTAGERVYFVEPRTGKASYLDIATQTIKPFADLGTSPTLNPTIVDAY